MTAGLADGHDTHSKNTFSEIGSKNRIFGRYLTKLVVELKNVGSGFDRHSKNTLYCSKVRTPNRTPKI